jgi:hypothetical protein
MSAGKGGSSGTATNRKLASYISGTWKADCSEATIQVLVAHFIQFNMQTCHETNNNHNEVSSGSYACY